MKTIFGLGLLALLVISAPAVAQQTEDKGVKKAWKGTKKGAKKAGNETAELATKGKGMDHNSPMMLNIIRGTHTQCTSLLV